MATRIILARHGETEWNIEGRYQGHLDTNLSARGHEQAQLLNKALQELKIDAIYSSPLKRAFETAELIARQRNLEVQGHPGFMEICHGLWEGMTYREVAEKYSDLLEKWRKNPVEVNMPEGENLRQLQDRALGALREIVDKHRNESVLIISHDATNKVIICGVMGISLENFWQVRQDNTCINVLEYEEGKWQILLLNNTCHLGKIITDIEQKAL